MIFTFPVAVCIKLKNFCCYKNTRIISLKWLWKHRLDKRKPRLALVMVVIDGLMCIVFAARNN